MMRSGKVLCLAILCLASAASAGPFDWYSWTGEVSNDFNNVNNWRWANASFYHPASMSTLLSSRLEIGKATAVASTQTVNIGDGATYTRTYSDFELDSGMTLNVFNGSTLVCAGGISGNGLGTDSLQDSIDGVRTSESNSLQTNLHIYGGGTVTLPGSFTGGTNTTLSGGDTTGRRLVGNIGFFVEGAAHVSIGGSYTIGDVSGGGTGGGGHYTVKGYDVSTTATVGGNMVLMPALKGAVTGGNAADASNPARIEIILDASNNGGHIDTLVVSGALDIENTTATKTAPVEINVSLAGYTPHAGQIFQVISAGSLTGGQAIDKGWDTAFTVSGTQFKLHNTGANGAGVYLEVVPEPATMSLLVLGGLGLIARKRR